MSAQQKTAPNPSSMLCCRAAASSPRSRAVHRMGRTALTAKGKAPGPPQLAQGEMVAAFLGGTVGLGAGCCSPAGQWQPPSCICRVAGSPAQGWQRPLGSFLVQIDPNQKAMFLISNKIWQANSLLQKGSTSDRTKARLRL